MRLRPPTRRPGPRARPGGGADPAGRGCAAGRPGRGRRASRPPPRQPPPAAATPGTPNIFIYNLDDLRDALPGGVDPLQFMPNAAVDGRGHPVHQALRRRSLVLPVAVLVDDRPVPHNNGVRLQSQGPAFDHQHSMACYLKTRATHLRGRQVLDHVAEDDARRASTTRPSCGAVTTTSTVTVDGVAQKRRVLDHVLGVRGREYIDPGLARASLPPVRDPAGAALGRGDQAGRPSSRRAVPEAKYATRPWARARGCRRPTAATSPPYVRNTNFTEAQAPGDVPQPAAGDHDRRRRVRRHHAAAVQPRRAGQHAGHLHFRQRLHVGRARSHREVRPVRALDQVPLWIRWPGHFAAGTNTTRIVSTSTCCRRCSRRPG